MGSSSGGTTAGTMVVNFFTAFFVGASMNVLWSTLNGLQLLVHFPLLYTPIPANAHYFSTYLIDVATFEFIPEQFLDLFDFPYKESYNLAMQSTGYSSMFTIGNMWTSFILINLFIAGMLIWLIMLIFKNCLRCALRSSNWLGKHLIWNFIMRLLLLSLSLIHI